MAALPAFRLGHKLRIFTYCGLDYFCPFRVKIGCFIEKRWAALFTCLTVRAIHIKMVNTLNADSAIMALRRLSARRGSPRILYSDNSRSFTKSDKELKALIDKIDRHKLSEYVTLNNLEWKYNPPSAP